MSIFFMQSTNNTNEAKFTIMLHLFLAFLS